MQNTIIMEKIKYHRDILLDYLFANEKTKENFINNKKVKLPKSFYNILYYPNESFLKGFLKRNINYNQLFTCITKIIKQDFKDNFNQTYRCIHPSFFLIFYEDFIKLGFEFNLTNTNTIKITHDQIYLRPQYYQCFKIYYFLINDNEMKEILGDNIKILYTNLTIEDHVRKNVLYSGRYIDMSYNLGKNVDASDLKVFIEINENLHNKDEDFLRMRQIYSHTLNKIVQFYIEDTLESIKSDLYKEFSKKFYNLDKIISINLYMVKINKFKFQLSQRFTQIRSFLKNGGFCLNEFLNMLDDWNFKKCRKFIKKMVKNKILNDEHFVTTIDIDELINNLKLKKKIDKNIKLNSYGITKILNYVRKKDWILSDDITKAYSKFMDCYYDMIEDLLSNKNMELNLIFDEHKSVKNFINSEKKIYDLGMDYLKKIYPENSSLHHHKIIPSLVEDRKSKIDYKDIENKISDKKLFHYFKKHTETQRVLKGYRWITKSEINTIVENFNNKNIDENLELDSDNETL
jgi:hypothetical protein